MIKTILAAISIILLLVGDLPYLINTIKGKTKPHLFSWLVWAILNVVNFLILMDNGGGAGTIVATIRTISTLTIFTLSLKNGFKDIKRTDVIFLFLSLITFIIWYNLTDPIYAAVLSSLTNVLSAIPTITKTWREPKSETLSLYAAGVIRQMTFIFSIASITAVTVVEPVASLLLNSLIAGIILFKANGKK